MKPDNNKQRKQDLYSHCNEPDEDEFIRIHDEFLDKIFLDLDEQTDEDGFIRIHDEFLDKIFSDLDEQTDEDEEREME